MTMYVYNVTYFYMLTNDIEYFRYVCNDGILITYITAILLI